MLPGHHHHGNRDDVIQGPKVRPGPAALLATGLDLGVRRRLGIDLKEAAWESEGLQWTESALRVGKIGRCLLLKEEEECGGWLQTLSLPGLLRCPCSPC